VKVLTVIAGAVDTPMVEKGPKMTLPSTSKYLPLEEALAAHAEGRSFDKTKFMTPPEYAALVVGDVLGGASGRTWRGYAATVVRVLNWLLGDSYLVRRPPGIPSPLPD
jgi:1-acylglycerone phosphate reductase